MKISMWMIAARFREGKVRTAIVDGDPEIEQVRVVSGKLPEETGGTVFAGMAAELFSDPRYQDTVLLAHRRDMIFIEGLSPEDVINEVLAAQDFYRSWETAVLSAAAGEEPFQKIIDLSAPVIENPMSLSLLDGTLVAWTKEYERLNSHWDYMAKWKRAPDYDDFEGFQNPDGSPAKDWTGEPEEYFSKDGHFLGFYLVPEKEPAAYVTVLEHRRAFHPGDRQCLSIMKNIFLEIIGIHPQSPIRSDSRILKNLLDGETPEKPLLSQLEKKAPPPPRVLLVFRAFEKINTRVLRGSLERRLRQSGNFFFVLDYGDTVAAVTAWETAERELKQLRLHEHWQIGVSLPFDIWPGLSFRYRQALFAIGQEEGRNGVRLCGDYIFQHIMATLSFDHNLKESLHPALDMLKKYDADHKSGLYDTLGTYLAHERNINLASESLHLHRNSLRHRLERITELTKISLDDPKERAYIRFSYQVQDAAKNLAETRLPPPENQLIGGGGGVDISRCLLPPEVLLRIFP